MDNKAVKADPTAVVTGIVCKECRNELPPMTVLQHVKQDFEKECPHYRPLDLAGYPLTDSLRDHLVKKMMEDDLPEGFIRILASRRVHDLANMDDNEFIAWMEDYMKKMEFFIEQLRGSKASPLEGAIV